MKRTEPVAYGCEQMDEAHSYYICSKRATHEHPDPDRATPVCEMHKCELCTKRTLKVDNGKACQQT